MNRKERRTIKKGQGEPAEFFCRAANKAVPGLFSMAEGFADPRHTSYITYPQKVMIATALMKNVCGITSMTQMTEQFNEETIIQNIGKICEMPEELKELPHFVTLNNYLSHLAPEYLESIRAKLVKNLIKGRAYEAARLDRKWLVIIDATEICSFKEQNDEFCLHKTYHKGTEDEKPYGATAFWKQKSFWGITLSSVAGANISKTAQRMKKGRPKWGSKR